MTNNFIRSLELDGPKERRPAEPIHGPWRQGTLFNERSNLVKASPSYAKFVKFGTSNGMHLLSMMHNQFDPPLFLMRIWLSSTTKTRR
eukprot:scaffold801_cov170-Amphora_coffeaeformis.AAC.8